jgi:hypothetical protein
MSEKIQKIVILGQSKKFITLARDCFPNALITVIPWRSLEDQLTKVHYFKFKKIDLVLVCGYDYKSSMYSYEKYTKVNITFPLAFINKVCSPGTIVVYISTLRSLKKGTWSRYQYAKNELAFQLKRKCSALKVLYIPTIINRYGLADINGGFFTRMIFNSLNKMSLLKTVSTNSLNILFLQALKSKQKEVKVLTLNSKLLFIRRSLFLDRLLRLICG